MQVGDREDKVVVSRLGFYDGFIQYSTVLVSTNTSKNARVKSLALLRIGHLIPMCSQLRCVQVTGNGRVALMSFLLI